MTQASTADWEIAIVLPLGVVASQLQRIETQLRLLNMKALGFAGERDNRALRAPIDARLEQISESIAAISGLVSDIEADLQPGSAVVTRTSIRDETASPGTHASTGAPPPGRDPAGSKPSIRRPDADRDD
jgi:hypothetical protein